MTQQPRSTDASQSDTAFVNATASPQRDEPRPEHPNQSPAETRTKRLGRGSHDRPLGTDDRAASNSWDNDGGSSTS